MVASFYAERTVEADGETFTLVINFGAIAAIEKHMPMPAILNQMNAGEAGVSTMAILLWGLLREHHRQLTEGHALTLVMKHGGLIGPAVNGLLEAAFAEPKDEKPRPPTRKKASTS